MSSLSAELSGRVASRTQPESSRRVALGALAVGAASSIAFAVITVTMRLSDVTAADLSFHHTGDYWYTATGVPTAVATAVLLFALRSLQPAARPRLTLAGATINALALGVLTVALAYSVATGAEARWGGTYVIATLVTFIGHALFVAGTWRAGLVPRPILAAWPVVWVMGSFAAKGLSPLLLAALYAVLAALVVRRT